MIELKTAMRGTHPTRRVDGAEVDKQDFLNDIIERRTLRARFLEQPLQHVALEI